MPMANNPKNGHTTLKDRPKPTTKRMIPRDTSGMVASKPLTEDEIRLISVNFQRKKPLNINTQKAIRGEMIKVYSMVTSGELPLSAGMKLVYILDKIRTSLTDEDKLRILERGGIQGEPFIGLIIEGPPERN